MAFCPNCKYEYNPEIFKCPDCEICLVAHLPIEEETKKVEYKDWVRLAILTSDADAEMLSDVLRSKDIPNFISSGSGYFGNTGQMGQSSFAPAGGGYVLMVPYEFVGQADIEAYGILGEQWEKSKLIDIE